MSAHPHGRPWLRRGSEPQRRLRLRLAQVLLATVVAAVLPAPCAHALLAGAPEGPESDSPHRRLDLRGEQSTWSGVGALVVNHSVYTGVLVDDRHVLTAAHVVAGVQAGTVRLCLPRRDAAPACQDADAVYVHPDFRGVRTTPHADLGVVRLAAPAPGWARRYALADAALTPGTRFTAVGLGAGADAAGGQASGPDPALRRTGANVADVLAGRKGSAVPALFMYDFDGPDGDGPSGGPTLGNRVETAVAPGDSGAPAFVETAGQAPAVAGILTVRMPTPDGNVGSFGSGGGGVLVHAHATWIRAVLAGRVPARGVSPPPPASPSAGADPPRR